MRPVISSMVYVPHGALIGGLENAIERLTVTHSVEQGDGSFASVDVRLYDDRIPRMLGVPRAVGFKDYGVICAPTVWERLAPMPFDIMANLPKITPRNKDQAAFMQAVQTIARGEPPVDFRVNAMTGTGKTVVTLWLWRHFQVPMIVCVPTNKLKNQWLGSHELKNGIRHFMGDAFVDKYVGVIQQNKCEWRGKQIVIAMVPSLTIRRDRYPEEMYSYFKIAAFDEVHNYAAPDRQEVFKLIAAPIRFGMTATNKEGPLAKALSSHLGPVLVVSKQRAMEPVVYIVKHKDHARPFSLSKRFVPTLLSRMKRRNEKIVKLVIERGHRRKRWVLVVGDRVKQLQTLMAMCAAAGIPENVMGLHVDKYKTGRKRINRNGKEVPEVIQVKSAELDRITRECSIIFATYQTFGEGTDDPKRDMGIEATPRPNVKQPIGRICRPHPGKPTPEWYSIRSTIMLPPANEWSQPSVHAEIKKIATAAEESYKFHNAKVVTV